MRIVVTIKQVPFVDQLKFDHATRCLVREGVESEINPFDKRALTQAVTLKRQLGAEVVVITMGPPHAKDALVEALAMGADRAVHLLGRGFAGADTLATARALALACRKIGFDLILAGRYATDAETAQVPPMLAELLDLPQLTAVTALQLSPDQKSVVARRELDDGFETLECPLPAVLSAGERLVKPIKVSPADLDAVKNKPIEVISPTDLSPDPGLFGVAGSPTWVSEIYSIEPARKHVILVVENNVDAIARQVATALFSNGLYKAARTQEIVKPKPRLAVKSGRTFWVVVELLDGIIRPATFELLGGAVKLANEFDGQVAAILIGHQVRRHVKTLAAYGADTVLVADAPALARYSTEAYTAVLAAAIQQHNPYAVLVPSTSLGRDLAPRVAARLNIGLTGDCIGLEIDGEGRLVQLKPAFGGNIVAPILTRTRPAMATIRPGMLQSAEPDWTREVPVLDLPGDDIPAPRVRVVQVEESEKGAIALDNAPVIVGIGMGLGGPDKIPIVQELAAALNAAVGATRKVVDAGWMPRQVQIGLTGRSISPDLYVAVGVSGKFNHTVGIQRSGLILAINNNPEADIFKQADYGIVGDAAEVIPALTRAIRELQNKTNREEVE